MVEGGRIEAHVGVDHEQPLTRPLKELLDELVAAFGDPTDPH